MNRWMPESGELHDTFLGEYPWASSFMDQYDPNYDDWTDNSREKLIPGKVVVTADKYIMSSSSFDCSIDEGRNILLPAKKIVDEMRLRQLHMDGRFYDSSGDLVAFDPGVFRGYDWMPSGLLINKAKLLGFFETFEV